ncbi:MAG TPA: MBL fold metallo-hydrolase [Syntrophales bacterium]|nr:MBL fold metallo-hydrolase [Syntrophales bacterium]
MEALARKKLCVSPAALAENLWLLGNYYFNLYLVQGESGSALIEAGISAIADRVIAQLEALDVSPTYLVITHPHADHVTGLTALRERYPEAIVVAGMGAKEFLTHPKALQTMLKEDRFMSNRLHGMGTRPGRPPIGGFDFPENHLKVKNECDIDLGGISLRCIKADGHAPGNIAVHIPALKALMVSDSLGFHFPGQELLPLFFTDFSDYINTIDYLETLQPGILGFGHQGPLMGPAAKNAFKVSRQATYDMLDRVMDEEKKSDELAEEIFREYYRDEFTLYSGDNIRSVGQLLVRRGRETLITRRITQ